jgi:hypothetical protein
LNLSVASNIYAGNEIRASGDVIAFYNSSDFRLKKDVTNLDECVLENLVMKLRPVEFTWKDDIGYEPRRNTRDVGFIAQEIEKLFPEVVSTDIYGYKNIQYDLLVSVGVATLRENNIRVEKLTSELKNLKSIIGG